MRGESPPLLFIAFFTSHRSPLSELLKQARATPVQQGVSNTILDNDVQGWRSSPGGGHPTPVRWISTVA